MGKKSMAINSTEKLSVKKKRKYSEVFDASESEAEESNEKIRAVKSRGERMRIKRLKKNKDDNSSESEYE